MTTQRISRLAIARMLCANLELAQYGECIRVRSIPPKQRKIARTFDLKCAECGREFVGKKKNRKFCKDKCRLAFNLKKHRAEKKLAPAKYEERRNKRNLAWSRFFVGHTDKPPCLAGRPTKNQAFKVREYQRSADRLRQLKRERQKI